MNLIRSATPDDCIAVRRIIVEAFTDCEFGYHGEADLVDQLRSNCDDLLELVAVENDSIVGHVLFSPVSVHRIAGVVPGMGLAPMAVAPPCQQSGIGTALVESGLEQLANRGCPFVVVLGHPDYYPRFGFQPGEQYGLSHGFEGIPQDVFFVKFLDRNVVKPIANETINYRPEFGSQEDGTVRRSEESADS